jgi:hypothetical protein
VCVWERVCELVCELVGMCVCVWERVCEFVGCSVSARVCLFTSLRVCVFARKARIYRVHAHTHPITHAGTHPGLLPSRHPSLRCLPATNTILIWSVALLLHCCDTVVTLLCTSHQHHLDLVKRVHSKAHSNVHTHTHKQTDTHTHTHTQTNTLTQ